MRFLYDFQHRCNEYTNKVDYIIKELHQRAVSVLCMKHVSANYTQNYQS